jgi:hypothetical protein
VTSLLRGSFRRLLARLRLPGRAEFLRAVRITVAAVASYVVASFIFPDVRPLLAPLTAMLVVQVTPVSLLAAGLDRVIAVITGVSLAVVFSARLPLEWWSLGILILCALTLGQIMRLQNNLIEVAISAMLVLGVGTLGAESAAWERMAETLVGAAVAIAANLLFPPKVATDDAGEAIDEFADRVSGLLSGAADQLVDAVSSNQDVTSMPPLWLAEARRITRDFPAVEAAVLHAETGRKLNVRAAFTSDAGPGLRQGLEALEHVAISVRSMLRAIVDATDDRRQLPPDLQDELALGLAQTLREMATGVDAFGQLVKDEAMPGTAPSADVATLTAALEGLHEARARLEDLMVSVDTPGLVETVAVLLTTVRRLLREMDLDERVRLMMRPGRVAPSPARPTPGLDETQGLPKVDPDAETEIIQQVRRRDRPH